MTQSPLPNELKACPFCGGSNISEGEVLTAHPRGYNTTQSMCMDCGALGPEAKLEADEVDYGSVKATAAWNTRPPIAPQPEVGERDYYPHLTRQQFNALQEMLQALNLVEEIAKKDLTLRADEEERLYCDRNRKYTLKDARMNARQAGTHLRKAWELLDPTTATPPPVEQAQEGPQTVTRKTCAGCVHLKTQDWVEYPDGERDSGTSADCMKADRSLGAYWSERTATPEWCPIALSAPVAPVAYKAYSAKLMCSEVIFACDLPTYAEDEWEITPLYAHPSQSQGCSNDPKVEHGFDRNASHSEDRYACVCESSGLAVTQASESAERDVGVHALMHYELEGVIYDTEKSGFDNVCLETVKRVSKQLADLAGQSQGADK